MSNWYHPLTAYRVYTQVTDYRHENKLQVWYRMSCVFLSAYGNGHPHLLETM